MSWSTQCSSTVQESPACSLPLIGLDGVITNLDPPMSPAAPVISSRRCTVSIFKHDCSSEYPSTCSQMNCLEGQVGRDCSCTPGAGSCGPSGVCTQEYTCTKSCFQPDPTTSCPQGKFLQSTGTTAICQYTSTSSNLDWIQNNLPSSFSLPMIQRFILMTYLEDWMNGLYYDPKSIFHSLNYLKSPVIENTIRSTLLNLRAAKYSGAVPNWGDFFKFLMVVPSLPQLIYSPDNFTILFYLYGTNQNLTSQELTSLIQGFTVERPSSSQPVGPVVSGSSVTFNSPDDLLTNKYYIIVNLKTLEIWNNSVTDLSQLVSISDLQRQGITGDFYIIGRIYPVKITRWSPNLLYLFNATYPNLPFTPEFCQKIKDQTLQVPIPCYNNSCSKVFTEECRSQIESYCSRGTLYNSGFTGINFSVQDFLLQAGAAQCLCYNTGLTPPIVPSGNRPGMCFTQSCTSNPPMSQAFGLTDEFCSNYCGEVYNWLTATDPAKRSLNPYVIDQSRYQKLCSGYNPEVGSRKLNYYVLGVGLGISVVLGLLLSLLTKWWAGLIIGVILIIVSLLLSYDLNGVPGCSGKEPVCTSKITHHEIPTSWCPYEIGCECSNFGGRCSDGSLCLAGRCFKSSS